MKKTILIVGVLVLLTQLTIAQSFPVNSFNDYEVGDVFHFETKHQTNTIQIDRITNRVITTKNTFSDSAVYGYIDATREVFSSSTLSYDTIIRDTSTLTINYLDSLRDTILPCSPSSIDYDSACSNANGFPVCQITDTLYQGGLTTCGDSVYRYIYQDGTYCSISGSYSIDNFYTKGVGLIYSIENTQDGLGGYVINEFHMNYSKKVSGKTCGSPYYVSTPELKDDLSFSIYPNPTNGILNIKGNFNPNSFIEILNVDGSLIEKTIFKNQLQLNLNKGVYFIKITDGNKVGVEKIIVN